MVSDDPPHKQDDAELERKARYQQRKRAYQSDQGVDGRPTVDRLARRGSDDPLLQAFMEGRR